jgi:hypothetical protein
MQWDYRWIPSECTLIGEFHLTSDYEVPLLLCHVFGDFGLIDWLDFEQRPFHLSTVDGNTTAPAYLIGYTIARQLQLEERNNRRNRKMWETNEEE